MLPLAIAVQHRALRVGCRGVLAEGEGDGGLSFAPLQAGDGRECFAQQRQIDPCRSVPPPLFWHRGAYRPEARGGLPVARGGDAASDCRFCPVPARKRRHAPRLTTNTNSQLQSGRGTGIVRERDRGGSVARAPCQASAWARYSKLRNPTGDAREHFTAARRAAPPSSAHLAATPPSGSVNGEPDLRLGHRTIAETPVQERPQTSSEKPTKPHLQHLLLWSSPPSPSPSPTPDRRLPRARDLLCARRACRGASPSNHRYWLLAHGLPPSLSILLTTAVPTPTEEATQSTMPTR
ncbi:hypothetical protein P171DRAFT_440068 [Karstenula rhodostoma CBS 690.94]|uniref:Uncharacterized protein n=1 Tax=Karstenula rhodostoma CBS 690.94 TaxID=1392251 RepID=A0A9P4UGH2_9PLEO|nr:hypothetical protein P171DRAFT_440068 [Karstenula rhodostoma CBS 690.94]